MTINNPACDEETDRGAENLIGRPVRVLIDTGNYRQAGRCICQYFQENRTGISRKNGGQGKGGGSVSAGND